MLKAAENLYTAGIWEALEHAPDARLKLLIEPAEISWYAELPAFRQIVFHGHLPIHPAMGETALKETMYQLIREQISLRISYKEFWLGAQTPGVLMEEEKLKENPEKNWLTIPDGEFLLQEQTNVPGTRWLYSYSAARLQWLKEFFPEIQLRHTQPQRIKVYQETAADEGKIGVHVYGNILEAAVFDPENTLLLTNRFPFRTETDFVYFILRLCERFGLSPQKSRIILSGQLDINSLVFKELYTFLGNISFIDAPFHGSLTGSSPHRHFGLYNLG